MNPGHAENEADGWFAGIDVGARRLHLVGLDPRLGLLKAEVLGAGELGRLPSLLDGALVAAIDAPDRLSTAPHQWEPGLAPKFRSARCAEIALGRQFGIWVPWTTPTGGPVAGWMGVGFRVFEILRGLVRAIETYPHGVFRRLAGGPIPRKQTAEGRAARIRLLGAAGIDEPSLRPWRHDALDAAAAALVTHDRHLGRAVPATCGHDASAIWLPPAGGRADS
ncbi:MAG: DUF429 domain-containing protein [Isosphaeraceae bacterium]